MKYSFTAKDDYAEIYSHKFEDGKKIKEPIEVTITIEMDKRKFDSLNAKYENGLSGRIEKLLK